MVSKLAVFIGLIVPEMWEVALTIELVDLTRGDVHKVVISPVDCDSFDFSPLHFLLFVDVVVDLANLMHLLC